MCQEYKNISVHTMIHHDVVYCVLTLRRLLHSNIAVESWELQSDQVLVVEMEVE